MEVSRDDLIARTRSVGAKAIFVVAPAGYGKSTFVRQLLPDFASAAVCDLAGAGDGVEVARRIVNALAHARPAQAESIAQGQVSLPNAFDDWSAYAIGVWTQGGPPAAFVFENAEALEYTPEGASLFRDVVHQSPRVVITCSRVPLPVPYGHGLSPSDVLVLRQDELRFSRPELDRALQSLEAGERDAIERVSHGWPVVVSLIARNAGTLLLDRIATLEDIVHEQLYEYLASQLLRSLSADQLRIVLVLARISAPTTVDVDRAVARDTRAELLALKDTVPMRLDPSTEQIQLHPLLSQIALRTYPKGADVLVRASAQAAAAAGDDVHAARLYLNIGDKHAAASAIRSVGLYLMSTPSLEVAEVLSALDGESLLEFPALWCAAMMHRGYSVPPYDWLRMAQHIWDHLPADVEPDVRVSVLSSLLNAHTNIGHLAEAADLLSSFEATVSPDDLGARFLISLFRAFFASADGTYDSLTSYTQELMPVLEASPVTHALYLYEVISPMHQARGETTRVHETLSRARELAATTTLAIGGLPTVEATFTAWVAGDDDLFRRTVGELELLVTPGTARGHRFFLACAQGNGAAVNPGYEKRKTRAQAELIASGSASTLSEAQSFARRAVASADASSRRYLRVISRVALAELVPHERDMLLDEALRLSDGLQSDPMREALHALRWHREDVGMLAVFVNRFRRLTSAGPRVEVRVLAGDALVDGRPARMPPSEFAVVALLARERRRYDSEQLCEELFPELDAEAAKNRLYLYVHRARQRLGSGAILGSATGYGLGPAVSADIWEAEQLIHARRNGFGPTLTADVRERITTLSPLARAELVAVGARARLPQAFIYRLEEVRRSLLLMRADDALERHAVEQTLGLADALVADDPGDEEGYRFRIRALLQRGDRDAAARAWAHSRAMLAEHVGVEARAFEEYVGEAGDAFNGDDSRVAPGARRG